MWSGKCSEGPPSVSSVATAWLMALLYLAQWFVSSEKCENAKPFATLHYPWTYDRRATLLSWEGGFPSTLTCGRPFGRFGRDVCVEFFSKQKIHSDARLNILFFLILLFTFSDPPPKTRSTLTLTRKHPETVLFFHENRAHRQKLIPGRRAW